MIEEILSNKTSSILLIEERVRKDIIIAAPHHTTGGVKNMPCPEHTDGDENTGLIARQIAIDMNLSSIIACNYTLDPNKNLRTDYSIQIAKWHPKYLIEIHGHGAKRLDRNIIEISSGKKERNGFSKKFSEYLEEIIKTHESLKKYSVNGDFENIYFRASNTATIIHDAWVPFHIELPPTIRLDAENKVPSFTIDFIKSLEKTINEICK